MQEKQIESQEVIITSFDEYLKRFLPSLKKKNKEVSLEKTKSPEETGTQMAQDSLRSIKEILSEKFAV